MDIRDLKKDVETGRAISIRQPYVEEILIGKKKYEYRSRHTKIRGRVFLYASNTLGAASDFFCLGDMQMKFIEAT